jgi:uncharacterized DUF497 family protein
MEFEWDAAKNEATRARPAFDFRFASGIFTGPLIEAVDTRRTY